LVEEDEEVDLLLARRLDVVGIGAGDEVDVPGPSS